MKKIIWQYYILSLLYSVTGMSIISATYVTYLIQHNISYLGTNIINGIYFLSIFLLEIPTGAIADLWGRKGSFVIACGLMSVSMFAYGYSETFFGFICAEILGACASTCKSGAFQAWLVDSLKKNGYQGSYHNIFSRESLYKQIGNGIGAIVGSHLSIIHNSLPWFFAGICLAITAIIAHIIMKEDSFSQKNISLRNGWKSMREIIRVSIKYGISDVSVRFLLTISLIQTLAISSLNMYWQPFFRNIGVKDQHLGLIFFGITMAIGIGNLITSAIKKGHEGKELLIGSNILTGLIVIILSQAPYGYYLIFIFLIHEIPRGSWGPLLDGYLQQKIPSNERATISSFCAMFSHIGGVIGLLLSGIIAHYISISTSWLISGIILVVGTLLVVKNMTRK